MSSQAAILSKFDNNIQLILTKFNEVQQLLILQDKDIEVQASDSIQIESNSAVIIRLIEELLSLTKNLKEKWILGQIHKTSDDILNGNNYQLYENLNNLLDNITNY